MAKIKKKPILIKIFFLIDAMTHVENFLVLYSGIIRYLPLNVRRAYRAISSRRRRIAIMVTPLKMNFIKAIFPSDRCRRKRRKPEPKGMRPLPLADPLRMIITSRRLNFALLRVLTRSYLRKVQRRSGLHLSLPSSPPPYSYRPPRAYRPYILPFLHS